WGGAFDLFTHSGGAAMNLRPTLIIATAIVVGCICLGLLVNQPSTGQQPQRFSTPPVEAPQVGRYQAFAGELVPNGGVRIIVCDTTTGECFVHWPKANGGKGLWSTASPPRPKPADRPKK